MRLNRFVAIVVVFAAGLALTFASCGETQVVEKEVVKVVTQQVPVEKVVTQIVERAKVVEKEVPVEVQKVVTRVVEKAVIQEKVVTKVVTQVVEVEMEAEAQDPLIVGHLNAFTGSLSYFGPAHVTPQRWPPTT